MVPTIFM